jgi:hypothetical protein
MLGFGLIAMLLVIVIPIALIFLLVWAFTQRGNSSVIPPVFVRSVSPSTRTCSHCGAALQPGWTYCSQCGAQA